MTRADDIYWGNGRPAARAPRRTTRARTKKAAAATRRRTAPWWLSFIIVTAIFTMLTVSINLRAFTQVNDEVLQNERLAVEIQSLLDENLALQEEIHALRSDPTVVERHAQKIGIDLKR